MAKNIFIPKKNETVLVEARVGKRIIGVYCVFAVLLAVVGGGLLAGGILAHLHGIPQMISVIVIGAVCIAASPLPFGHYVSTQNRRYVLTNKRIVILKGGKIRHNDRSLSLKSIQGVERNDNLFYERFGLSTIDFYALAVASNTTKIKIFSFSSTNFKFQWVDKHDAARVYDLMQEYLVQGEFPTEE